MTSYFPFIFYLVLNSSYNCYAYHSLPLIFRYLACVASASNRDIAQKLERERKKMESGRRAENRKKRFLLSPPPPPPPPPSFLFFFCSRPNFLDELARKRLLRRLPFILLKFCSKLPYSAGRMFASKLAYPARTSAGRIYPSYHTPLRNRPGDLQRSFCAPVVLCFDLVRFAFSTPVLTGLGMRTSALGNSAPE